jgi:hypothetical protein
MAVGFTGTKIAQTELPDIIQELYQDSATYREKVIDIQEGHKSGTAVYETRLAVTAKAASSGPVTADGTIDSKVNRTSVTLGFVEFSDFIDERVLLDTRFERSMQAGAYNLISDEYDNKVLQQIQPAIGEAIEYMIWNGAMATSKTAIAALTPAAPQGSISAGAQTLVAAMPTNLIDSLPTTILYNSSQAKVTPGAGLGDYKKVLTIVTPTAANIAAEYSKIYSTGDPKVVNNMISPPIIFAPLGDRQLIKIANNTVGAAQQINFLIEGAGKTEKIYYNGIEVKFVPLIGFRILCDPKYLKILMDLVSDMNTLEMGPVANGAQQRWYKNIQTFTTWCVNQRYITLYGG